MTQVGNPDGEDKPNKKYFDPRKLNLTSLEVQLLIMYRCLGS